MILLTIWPLFGLICFGGLLAWRGFPESGFWPAAERLNYFILFPALLLSSLADAPVRDPSILRLGLAAIVTIGIASIALFGWRMVRPMPAARFGPWFQGGVRFNTYLGLAITASLAGAGGLKRAAVLLAVAVPLVNVLSIVALSRNGVARRPIALIATVLANPLIVACMAGIAIALTGFGLPFGLDRFFGLLGQGSLLLGLLCVGAALRPSALRRDWGVLATNSALRLVAMPILALGVARTMQLDGIEALVLVIFCAIPTAPTAYVLTRQFGGDGLFMAGLVTGQTMLAVVTIPMLLWFMGFA
ncbi:AEC family transporter [Yoonia sp.]|uniref:AEC family transporter n=1 Tax=Yoonia sp. TaxID=2212373 RepID=UPI0023B51084